LNKPEITSPSLFHHFRDGTQDDGGEWATLTEILGIDAPFLLHGANDPAFIVCAESDGGLLVRDKDFVALETFATPYALVTALRRLL
jgi:hypothetical protein